MDAILDRNETVELLNGKMTAIEAARALFGEKWDEWDYEEQSVAILLLSDDGNVEKIDSYLDFAGDVERGWDREETEERQEDVADKVCDFIDRQRYGVYYRVDPKTKEVDEDYYCENEEELGRAIALDEGYEDKIQDVPFATIDYKALAEQRIRQDVGHWSERLGTYVFIYDFDY